MAGTPRRHAGQQQEVLDEKVGESHAQANGSGRRQGGQREPLLIGNMPFHGETVAFFPSRGQAAVAERLHELLCPGTRGGQSALVQPGFFAFRHELSRALRRPHLSTMFENEGVDVLAAHHTTPSRLIDLANLFRNHETAAPEASIVGYCCLLHLHV